MRLHWEIVDRKKTIAVPQSEFPEFLVEAGKAQAHLSSDPPGSIDTKYTESYAFQERSSERHEIMRDYRDETGEWRKKRDYGQEQIEKTWRDNTGIPVEKRREKEIKTTGFPEAFNPRPMPHREPGWDRCPEPIVRRQDEMHIPEPGGGPQSN